MKLPEQQFTLTEGLEFLIGEDKCRVVLIKGKQVVVEINDKLLNLSSAMIQSYYRNGQLTLPRPKACIALNREVSSKDYQEALFKQQVVLAMQKVGGNAPTKHENILEAYETVEAQYKAEKKPLAFKFPHTRTACRWFKKYRENNDVYDLVRNPNQTQGHGRPLPPELYDVMDAVIWEHVFERNKSVNESYQHLIRAVEKKYPQFEAPSLSTLYARHDEIDENVKISFKKGIQAAKQSKKQATTKFESYHPYQRWESDGLHVQVGILCDYTGKFIGVPTVMFCVDTYGSVCMGRSVRFSKNGGETSELAVECFKNSVLPNEHGEGPCGLPNSLAGDAGKAYTSNAYTQFAALTGTNRITVVAKHPEKKPFAERFNGTCRMRCLRKMPGYKGFTRLDEGFSVYEGVEEAAVLTASEFIALLDEFIDKYNNAAHKSYGGRSPLAVWEKALEDNPALMRMPTPDVLELFTHFSGRTTQVTIQKGKGIEINGRFYNSPELAAAIPKVKGVKKNITVYYNEIDIKHIVVVNPNSNDYVIVPITDRFVTGPMSRATYDAMKANPYEDIPEAEPYYSEKTDQIIDAAKARKKQQLVEKKREKARKATERRNKAHNETGVRADDPDTLNAVIDAIVENGTPCGETLPTAKHEHADKVVYTDTPVNTDSGRVRGEF